MSDSRFIEYGTSVGSLKEAGLPNITGSIVSNHQTRGLFWAAPVSGSNSLIVGNTGKATSTGTVGSDRGITDISFDASKSNTIYGNSTTVQPKSLVLTGIIKY